MLGTDSYLRWLYRSGRPDRFAKLQNSVSAVLFAAGVAPRRAAALGIRGRRSGRLIRFPVVLTEFGDQRYVVSMLGPNTNWIRNLAAADGHAELRHGLRETVHLAELDPEYRAPILKRYLRIAPGARPHFPIGPNAPLVEFERIAADFPVYRVEAYADR